MSKGIYAGALTEKPIYGEIQTLSLSLANFDEFFTVSRHNETCKIFDVNRDGSPVGVLIEAADTTQSIQLITLTAKQTITNFYGECFYTGGSNTKVQFRVRDTYIIDGLSGTDMSGQKSWRGTLYEGDVVTFYFLNGTTSGYCAYLNCTCDPISYTPILGYETVSVAKKVNNFYVPAIGPVPIYGEVTHTNPALSSSNYTSYYFSAVVDLSAYGVTFVSASHGGLRFTPRNIGTHSSEGGYGFVTLYDLKNVKIYCKYTTETNYDKVSFWIGEEKILDAVSGTKAEAIVWEGDLPKDTLLDFFYTKDGSQHASGEAVYWEIVCDPSTYTANEITGYEEGVAARKVKKGYVSINGVAKLFYGTSSFESYTGNYTVSDIIANNTRYELYTLTSSGTLVLKEPAEFWICGGGGAGFSTSSYSQSGGGGGGGYCLNGELTAGSHYILIGAGGKKGSPGTTGDVTYIDSPADCYAAGGGRGGETVHRYGGKGGSGGGEGIYISSSGWTSSAHGTGSGVSTYPFGITTLQAHCAGGGGGGQYSATQYYCRGGDGGTSGSNGKSGTRGSDSGGDGGNYGGGRGGSATSRNATDGSFYGAGGGGGGSNYYSTVSSGSGGSGYQGVCYLLIPA
jgi:hypothetical protein